MKKVFKSKGKFKKIKNNKIINVQLGFDFLAKDDENKTNKDGCICDTCNVFYPYSEPNQDDGKTLICWSCRNFN